MRTINMPVSQTVNGKREEIGAVNVTVPVIEDIIPFMGAKVTGEEDGLPVYDSDEANFVMSALAAYTKAAARNKLIPKTATVKEGLKIAENWTELCEEGQRGGNGEALAILREVKSAFADWAKTLGKSVSATAMIVDLFGNRVALATQSEANKGKMQGYVEAFADSLAPEQLERFQRPIENVLATCQQTSPDDF